MKKLTVKIPNSFVPERMYIVRLLFSYFKDIEVVVQPDDVNDYVLSYEGKNSVVKSLFWNKEQEDYLHLSNIPTQIDDGVIQLSKPFPIVALYGKVQLDIMDEGFTLHTDIFASAFYMVTRWEEYVCKDRDEHGRFPDESALAIKMGFHLRPIVNEYIDLLQALLTHLDHQDIALNRTYQCYVTHDVDEVYRLRPFSTFVNVLGADVVRRKSVVEAFRTVGQKFKMTVNAKSDSSYNFDWLMDVSERYGLTSYFYFIPGKKGEVDFRYEFHSPDVKKVMERVHKRGHVIGFHPSYSTHEDEHQLEKELVRLKNDAPQKITEGRHHYLRFSVPFTWRNWEALGLQVDSSLGFHNTIGFRTGLCFTYPVFDVLNRKQLALNERPLLMMEVALRSNESNPQVFKNEIVTLSKIVRKYQGDFVFLWHNNNISHPFWRDIGYIYEDIIKEIA